MKIGITYNLKGQINAAQELDSEFEEEFDSQSTIDAICGVFEKNGFTTVKLSGDIDIVERLKRENVDFIFNMAEGYKGRNRESQIPSILEALNIPYSGSDSLTLGLTLDKITAKKLMRQAKIPTPAYKVVREIKDCYSQDTYLKYPLITKPAWEGSSKGIYDRSKVFSQEALIKNVMLLFEKYPGQPILIEEYIEGREITTGVIGNRPAQILGLMEVVSKINLNSDFFYSLETKRNWRKLVEYISPPNLDRQMEDDIKHYALQAFKEFDCRDIARIDFRISKDNKIFLLEINPLPGLSPEYSDLVIMSQKNGIKYESLILSVLRHAFSRYNLNEAQEECIKNI